MCIYLLYASFGSSIPRMDACSLGPVAGEAGWSELVASGLVAGWVCGCGGLRVGLWVGCWVGGVGGCDAVVA